MRYADLARVRDIRRQKRAEAADANPGIASSATTVTDDGPVTTTAAGTTPSTATSAATAVDEDSVIIAAVPTASTTPQQHVAAHFFARLTDCLGLALRTGNYNMGGVWYGLSQERHQTFLRYLRDSLTLQQQYHDNNIGDAWLPPEPMNYIMALGPTGWLVPMHKVMATIRSAREMYRKAIFMLFRLMSPTDLLLVTRSSLRRHESMFLRVLYRAALAGGPSVDLFDYVPPTMHMALWQQLGDTNYIIDGLPPPPHPLSTAAGWIPGSHGRAGILTSPGGTSDAPAAGSAGQGTSQDGPANIAPTPSALPQPDPCPSCSHDHGGTTCFSDPRSVPLPTVARLRNTPPPRDPCPICAKGYKDSDCSYPTASSSGPNRYDCGAWTCSRGIQCTGQSDHCCKCFSYDQECRYEERSNAKGKRKAGDPSSGLNGGCSLPWMSRSLRRSRACATASVRPFDWHGGAPPPPPAAGAMILARPPVNLVHDWSSFTSEYRVSDANESSVAFANQSPLSDGDHRIDMPLGCLVRGLSGMVALLLLAYSCFLRPSTDAPERDVRRTCGKPTRPPRCAACGGSDADMFGEMLACPDCGQTLCVDCFPPVAHTPCKPKASFSFLGVQPPHFFLGNNVVEHDESPVGAL